MQPSQYKDGKQITKTMRELHAAGKLNELQGRVFAPTRPVEELYDLDNDPFETVNLAARPEHQQTVKRLRSALYDWMVTSRDMGLVPEPVLEDLGKKYGSKYDAMRHADQKGLIEELIRVADAGAWGRVGELNKALKSPRPSVRYWAAIGLGNTGRAAAGILEKYLDDPSATVRIAAALGLCRRHDNPRALRLLAREIDNANLVVGLYAIRAIEELGDRARSTAPAILKATGSKYNTTQRVANRLVSKWRLAKPSS